MGPQYHVIFSPTNILEANSERIEVEEDLNDQDSENLCEHGEQYEDSDSRPI